MCERRNYYMQLLEGRTKRLNELIEIAAPDDMVCQEIFLMAEAASTIEPTIFKSWKVQKDNNEDGNRLQIVSG